MDEAISVVVQGSSISPYRQETMAFIVDVISRAVLDGVRDWQAANTNRSRGAPLPAVILELQPPNLMLALRTDA